MHSGNIKTIKMVMPGELSTRTLAVMLFTLKGSEKVISVGWRWYGTKKNGVTVASRYALCVSVDMTVDQLAEELMQCSWDHALDECRGTLNLDVVISYDV